MTSVGAIAQCVGHCESDSQQPAHSASEHTSPSAAKQSFEA
jgi:hypothetical protein